MYQITSTSDEDVSSQRSKRRCDPRTVLTVLALILFAATVSVVCLLIFYWPTTCSNGWYKYNEACYQTSKEMGTYSVAKLQCELLGARLGDFPAPGCDPVWTPYKWNNQILYNHDSPANITNLTYTNGLDCIARTCDGSLQSNNCETTYPWVCTQPPKTFLSRFKMY